MTIYRILNAEIKVPTEIENSRYINRIFNPYFKSAEDMMTKWYRQQGDCARVLKNVDDIRVGIVADLLDDAFGVIAANEIYTIDKDSLGLRFLSNCFNKLDEVVDLLVTDLNLIDFDKESAAEYRRERKASRDKWVGGGFGLSGALKGAATAGALNAASGIGHSVFNAAGNIASSVGAGIQKGKLYSEYEEFFFLAANDSIKCIKQEMREILKTEKNIHFSFQSEEDQEKGNAIHQNFVDGNISLDKGPKVLSTALSLNYYNQRIYETIWLNYGDPTGDLVKMANDFDIPLKKFISACIADFEKKTCDKYCPDFMKSKNKINASLKYENEIKAAISCIQEYCKHQNVPFSEGTMLKTLGDYLGIADKLKKTVEGVYYNTEVEANNVRHDIEVFDNILDIKNIYDDDAFETLSKVEYLSQAFTAELKNRFESERILRDPHKILDTLYNLTVKENQNKKTSTMFGVLEKCGNIGETRSNIEEICMLRPNEKILAIIDRSVGIFSNKGKGKSGILFTNLNLRIFSKQLLAKENETFAVENIQNIEALGGNEYVVSTKNRNRYKFEIHLGELSIEEQNQLAELIFKCINIIRHIYVEQRIELAKILHPEGVRCICGKYILKSEKICPNCHRFVGSNGEFTDSTTCPNCNGYIKINSRFCSKCGHEMSVAQDEAIVIEKEEDISVGIDTREETVVSPKIENAVCPSCGKENPIGKKFCKYCGGKLSEGGMSIAVKLCPNCGNEIKPGKAFCGKCGSKI